MNVKRMAVMAVIGLCLPLLMGQGCQPASEDELTDLEKQALVAATGGAGGLIQATNISQNAAEDESSGQLQPDSRFGTCPEVTLGGAIGQGVTLTVDFGETPCTSFTYEGEDYVCSGSATGTFSLVGKTMTLDFDQITCNDAYLNGTADLTWSLSMSLVSLDGDWGLDWGIDDWTLATAGSGLCTYERYVGQGGYDTTSIVEFVGTVTEEDDEWSLSIDNLKMSLEQYFSFMPYSGSITISGPDIRTMTITFSENSPVNGEVTVTFESGRSVTVNLFDLMEELEEPLFTPSAS